MSQRRVAGRNVRPVALGASVVFHAVLVLVLARFLAQTPIQAEAPVMRVTLVSPPERSVPRQAAKREISRERRVETTTARATPAIADLPVAPRIAAPGDGGVAGRAQQALQGLAGCERAGLSREERERCETRRWASADAPATRLNLDPSGRYVEDAEPFLSRRPKKGCRVRAAGDTNAMGDSGNARAGFTCVIPF